MGDESKFEIKRTKLMKKKLVNNYKMSNIQFKIFYPK